MEAPKKVQIGLKINDYDDWEIQGYSFLEDKQVGMAEYTRTDVFIEKACDAYCKVCGHYPHKTPTHICRQDCDYFDDFKRYLKGSEE